MHGRLGLKSPNTTFHIARCGQRRSCPEELRILSTENLTDASRQHRREFEYRPVVRHNRTICWVLAPVPQRGSGVGDQPLSSSRCKGFHPRVATVIVARVRRFVGVFGHDRRDRSIQRPKLRFASTFTQAPVSFPEVVVRCIPLPSRVNPLTLLRIKSRRGFDCRVLAMNLLVSGERLAPVETAPVDRVVASDPPFHRAADSSVRRAFPSCQ